MISGLPLRYFCLWVMLPASLLAAHSTVTDKTPSKESVHPPLLVDVDWLANHIGSTDTVILDARSPDEYEKGHIPGAINFPPGRTYRVNIPGRVASQFDFQEILGNTGITNETHIVVYGSALYLSATHVFWTLELYGHNRISVLNGAFPAWRAAGHPVDTRFPDVVPANYSASIRPGNMATRLQLLLAIKNTDITLVDTRKAPEFDGTKSRARRFGHIPTAINIPHPGNLEVQQGIYYLKPWSTLEQLYASLDDSSPVLLYCNTGREASLSYLALRLLGRAVMIYDGGWLEWGNAAALPIVSPAPR